MKYCTLNGIVYSIKSIQDNLVTLEKDNLIIKTNIDKITFLDEGYTPSIKRVRATIHTNDQVLSNEIMLRHLSRDEAINELDKFIDKAIIAKLGRIRIIHGRHGGILRKATHGYLSSHPFIKEFYLAPYGEGDIGVTIAIIGKKGKPS